MAYTLTSEELIEQAKLLTTKTDSTTNPNMQYKTLTSSNTGLNPDYFSKGNSSIVNAINLVMKKVNTNTQKIETNIIKFNSVIGDTSDTSIAEQFENLKQMMGKDTIVEGLVDLYGKNIVTEDTVTDIVTTNVETAVEEKLSWQDNSGGDN